MISVIVPVYNAEKTLAACIQSILAQSCRDLELILVDDGSEDKSGKLCDEWQESCGAQNILCRVVHQRNRGVSAARNCGMALANGEYFVCIDSDDVIEPCYLEDLLQTAKAHAELGHILCGFRCTSHMHDYILKAGEELSVTSRRDYMLLFEKILIQSPCLALYRTEIVRSYALRMREDLSRAEDILFNLDYLDAIGDVPIGVINKTNYVYQDQDRSSLFRKYRPELLSINESVDQAVAEHLKRWEVSDEISWRRYYNMVFCNYQKVLANTFHEQNPMTKREKIAFNDAIIERKAFRAALEHCTVSISPPIRLALESGDYRKVMTAERLQRIKHVAAAFLSRIGLR